MADGSVEHEQHVRCFESLPSHRIYEKSLSVDFELAVVPNHGKAIDNNLEESHEATKRESRKDSRRFEGGDKGQKVDHGTFHSVPSNESAITGTVKKKL